MDDATPSANQNQTQSQTQSLVVSIQSSSDVGLERRIFSEVASAGRQLGRISDVLAILLDTYKSERMLTDDQLAAFADFDQMRAQIAAAREARDSDRIIEGLATLRSEDRAAYDRIVSKIDEWRANDV